jgi:sulfur-oxidizing protein SoxX
VRGLGLAISLEPPHPDPLPSRSWIYPTSSTLKCRTRVNPSSGGERERTDSAATWRRAALGGAAAVALVTMTAILDAAAAEPGLRSYTVTGDAIPVSLTGTAGDPERGRAIVVNRQVGLCLLCHSGPFPEERFQGTLAPDLKGTGARWTAGQLRLRIVDSSRLNPDTIMPSYYRVDGLVRVAPAFRGKPVLTAEQIEDVVAYLATMRD